MLLLLPALALAHSGLTEPPPRYSSDGYKNNKACPCGVGGTSRYCDDPSDRSDPDRSTAVTVYQAGDTITMQWHEVVGHAGRWRVAFDDDGADMDDFNANILLDIADPSGSSGNMGLGDLWEVSVTLPTTPCDNCTLQLVQMMDGNTTDPVADPTGRSSYYQCADIVIEAAAVDTGTPVGTTGTTDTAVPTGGTTPTGTPSTTGGSTPTGGTEPTNSTSGGGSTPGTDDTGAAKAEAEGCGCSSTSSGAVGVLALLPLLAVRRRR